MEALAGRFNDGRTAASRDVQVFPKLTGLELRDGDGLLVAFWRREDLLADGTTPDGKGVRLRCGADPDARLTLGKAEASALAHMLPAQRRKQMPWRTLALSAASAALLGLGIWKGIPAGARLLTNMIPLSLEQRWGDHLAGGLQQQWGLCQAPAGEAALRLLSDRLAAGMPPALRPRRVIVVKTAAENAIALPGGTVMIFSGLLDNATDSGELAGVLAHEFTHLEHRHPTSAMVRAMGLGAIVTLLTGDASGLLATGAAMTLAGSYSREDETEADRGGVSLLHKAGLNARGLSAFFRRLAAEKSGPPTWMSTHPDSAARADMVDTLDKGTMGMPALSPDQWTALKAICR